MRLSFALLLVLALALAASGCSRGDDQGREARPAPSIPWQPHGLRAPSTRCTFDVPDGWTRSPSPMPDHIAELFAGGPTSATTMIIAERVEPDVPSAAERVRAYWGNVRPTTDRALEGARASGRVMSIPAAGRVETVVLVAFPGKPVIEIVARHGEGDSSVLAVARTLTC